jgi:hypothetical protein
MPETITALPDNGPLLSETTPVPDDGGWVHGVWAWLARLDFPGGTGWLIFWAIAFTAMAVGATVVVVRR